VDYQCYRQARAAGLRGSFRAFLAPGPANTAAATNLDSVVKSADWNLPIVNIKVIEDQILALGEHMYRSLALMSSIWGN
jgi:hypothetical protein